MAVKKKAKSKFQAALDKRDREVARLNLEILSWHRDVTRFENRADTLARRLSFAEYFVDWVRANHPDVYCKILEREAGPYFL